MTTDERTDLVTSSLLELLIAAKNYQFKDFEKMKTEHTELIFKHKYK